LIEKNDRFGGVWSWNHYVSVSPVRLLPASYSHCHGSPVLVLIATCRLSSCQIRRFGTTGSGASVSQGSLKSSPTSPTSKRSSSWLKTPRAFFLPTLVSPPY
jgi:hypothetical protein